jgi:hypothetical protein
MAMIIWQCLAVATVLSVAVGAWNVPQQGDCRSAFPPHAVERRDVLAAFGGAASSTLLHPFIEANAADSAAINGKLRTVELLWDDRPTVSRNVYLTLQLDWMIRTSPCWNDVCKGQGGFPAAVDGINSENTPKGTAVSLICKLPDKWADGYVDRIIKQKACDKILVHQKTGSALPDALDKAASGQWKISRALDIGDRLDPDLCWNMKRADVIGQRTIFKDVLRIWLDGGPWWWSLCKRWHAFLCVGHSAQQETFQMHCSMWWSTTETGRKRSSVGSVKFPSEGRLNSF